jgi:imidazolonepropionase-like amidohydrolase
MLKFINILFAFICVFQTRAQQTPAPPQQAGPMLIMNATAHLGNGKVIENSVIAFENGKITMVADATLVRIDISKYVQVINAHGKHVYPGLIAPNTQIGLVEIEGVRATRDDAEVGAFNPSVRSLIALDFDSRVIPTIRSNGVLLAQVVPAGGRMPGQSSVVELDAWNWEDAAYQVDGGMHLNWPSPYSRSGWWAEPGRISQNKDYDKQVQEVAAFFEEAKAYSQNAKPTNTNLKFEAMRGLFAGDKKLCVNVDESEAIMQSVLFAKKYGLKCVVVGGGSAWQVADFLKENNVPVILAQVHSLPSSEDGDIDQPYKNAALLDKAGVAFAFSMEGAWQQRNLSFQAGQAVAFGLDREAAVKALTGSTAEILGIGERVGTLEPGKDATLIITKGDVLDMRTAEVEQAFIRGRSIDLDNKQKELARKFRGKYKPFKN